MSGLFARIKGMFSSEIGDTVSDAIEEHVTSEQIDDVLDKVPGGDMIRGHVPEDAGEQIGGAARGFIAEDGEKPEES